MVLRRLRFHQPRPTTLALDHFGLIAEVSWPHKPTGRTVLVQADGWDGPGPGFLLFPLIVIGLFLLFASRRGRWRGPRGYGDDDMREWHRRQHGDEPATPTN